MTDMDKAGIIVWSLIFVLFVITAFIIRWSIKVHKKIFEKTIEKQVQKELDKREATARAREPKPGSDAHYEAWRAEQLKKNQDK